MECLICKRTGQKLFNINQCCGDGQNTIKDDIIEFVGDTVIEHLNDKQHVCNICMNMLDDIVKSKFKVLEAILIQGEQKYIPNMGKLWTYIAKSSKFREDTYIDPITPSLTPNTPPIPPSRDATPLLFVSRTKAYNERVEKDVERREGIKSELKREIQSSMSSRCSSIASNVKGRKRTKNTVRSKSADVKKMRREIVKSVLSDRVSRPISAVSEMSLVSCTDDDEQVPKSNKRLDLVYDGDEIIYPVKRTRSVSRSHEQIVQEKEQKKKKDETKKLFTCPYPECKDIDFGESLIYITAHLTMIHKTPTYFRCWECDNEYYTREHLKMHLDSRDVYPVCCGICGQELPKIAAYQKHIDQHLASSFKCFLCDLAFITKKECNNHIFSNHRRRKMYDRVEQRVLHQCVYKKQNEPVPGPKTYTFGVMNLTDSSKPAQVFKKRSFPEFDYLLKKRLALSGGDVLPVSDERPFSLGDDLVVNKSYADNLKLGKNIATPNSMFRDDISLPDWCSTTSTPTRRRRRRPTRDSTRSSPYEKSNVNSDDEHIEVDMRSLAGSTWSSTRRDLESRNTEVADIFAGDEEEDESDHESGGRSSRYGSDQEEDNNAESDVDTETQYLDGENFLTSINDFESNSEKS